MLLNPKDLLARHSRVGEHEEQSAAGGGSPLQVAYKKGLIVNRTYMRTNCHHLRKSV